MTEPTFKLHTKFIVTYFTRDIDAHTYEKVVKVCDDYKKALEWVDALCYAEDTLKEYSPVRFDSLEVGF